MEKRYRVYFNVEGLEKSIFKGIDGLETVMGHELIRVYNMYADKTNSGITEQLNSEFDKLYPNYFHSNSGKEWYELLQYNKFMADDYQRLVVDDMNKSNISPLLDFYVDPEEVVFKGRLKVDPNVTIDFYMKEA